MKLSFKQKNTLRLIILLIVLFGICVFIYFELKKDADERSLNLGLSSEYDEKSSSK